MTCIGSSCSPLRRAKLEGKRQVRLLHEPVTGDDPPAVVGKALARDAILGRDPGHVAKLHGQEYVLLVQDLVVLEAVQQRIGRSVSGSEVRNTAVPGTRNGGFSRRDWIRPSNGGDEPRSCSSSASRPRRQVIMTKNMIAASASGNQPPSSTLCMAAAKNTASTTRKNAVARDADPQRVAPAVAKHEEGEQAWSPASCPSPPPRRRTASRDELPNPMTAAATTSSRIQFTAGT